MPQAKKPKVIVWDVDGPINSGVVAPSTEVYRLPAAGVSAEEMSLGEHPLDFCVANKIFLQMTLDILQRNGVQSVVGSQRIQMRDDDPHFGNYLRSMYASLDHFFGPDRPYLSESLARKIGAQFQDSETNLSKNLLLGAYAQALNVPADEILLIDDHDSYKGEAEQAGFQFVHAPVPKKDMVMTPQANGYLFETLVKTLPVHQIYQSLQESNASPQDKAAFKQQFLAYQLNHLTQEAAWQVQPNQEPWKAQEQADRNILLNLKELIHQTKWEIGFLGGVNVKDEKTGMINKVPKGMSEILKVIQLAETGKTSAKDALDCVSTLVDQSAAQKNHSVFNKRGETTQMFYDHFRAQLKEMREPKKQLESPQQTSSVTIKH